MPRCKQCSEPALPTGKRYCAFHKAEYERKTREYEATARTLRSCESCGARLSKTSHDAGEKICGLCAEQDALRQAWFEEQASRNKVALDQLEQLEACQTVEDLKDFIRMHLIKSG